MKVTSIFKILIGFYVALITACLLIETCNICLYSSYINSYIRTSIRKGCEYFSSETYRDGRAVVSLPGIKNNTNTATAVSGDVYGGTGEANVWNNLYGNINSAKWKEWTNSIKNSSGSGSGGVNWATMNKNMYYLCNAESNYIGKFYKDARMTPTNLGVPFVGLSGGGDNASTSLENISKWVLASLLSNGNSELVHNTGTDAYVNYNGFKVYVNQLQITNKEYRVYNLTNSADQEAFRTITNMEGATLASNAQTNAGKYGFTVAITYSVPIEYEGITPFKTLFSWIRSGYDDSATNSEGVHTGTRTNTSWGLNGFYNGTINNGYNDTTNFNTKTTLTGGGYDANNTSLSAQSTSNKIVYYLIH
jgi:hypothetical protein